jgi:hypothetical protein
MAVPTANVILGFSASAMDYVKSHGSSYSNLIEQSKKEGNTQDFMLFDHVNNPNFINFEYQFGLGGNNHRATLTFIDPMNEFERRYISRDMVFNLAGFGAVGGYNTAESQTNNTGRIMPASGMIYVDSTAPEVLKEDMRKRFQAALGSREVYLMFGVGSNMGSWAGPYKMYITNATLDVKEARKITLSFTPDIKGLNLASRMGAFGESINYSLNGLTSVVKGDSMNLDLVPGKPLTTFIRDRFKAIADEQRRRTSGSASSGQKAAAAMYTSFNDSLQQGYGIFAELVKFTGSEFGYPEELQGEFLQEPQPIAGGGMLGSNIPVFDIHSVVVETIRDYIKNATGNPNVIVLLPNLNIYLREWIIDRMLEARNSKSVNLLRAEDQAAATAYRQSLSDPNSPNYNPAYDPTFAIKTSISGSPLKLPFAAASQATPGANYAYGDYSENLTAVKNILAGLGFRLVLRDEAWSWDPEYSEERRLASLAGKTTQKLAATPIKSVIPNSRIFMLDPQDGQSAAETVQSFINQNQFRANLTTRSNTVIPNHELTLNTVKESIQARTQSSYPLEIVSFTENDKDVISYWNTLSPFPTFGGVQEYLAGEHPLDVSPVQKDREYIIWGDLGLINAYLYGNINLDQREKDRKKFRDDMKAIQAEHAKRLQPSHASYTLTNPPLTEEQKTDLHKKLKNDEFTALLKSFTVYSLGPADYAILANPIYQDYLSKVLEPKRSYPLLDSRGPFNSSNLETDSFEFTNYQIDSPDSKYLYPVFRYNMKDSNVLELATNFGFNYFSVLDFGVNKRIDRLASEVVAGTLDTPFGSFPIQTMDDAVKFVTRLSAANGEPPEWAIKSLRNRLGPDLFPDPGTTADALIELILIKVKENQAKTHNTTVLVPQDVDTNPFSILSQVASKAYRLAVQAKIKTLPFFGLSTLANTMNSHCVLLAQDAPIIKQWSKDSPLNRSLLNSFFSGTWRIMGFKHVISGDGDCFSEFNLTAAKPSLGPGKIDEDFIRKQEGYNF